VTCRVHVDQRADNSNHTVPPVAPCRPAVSRNCSRAVMKARWSCVRIAYRTTVGGNSWNGLAGKHR
jgi:hypothetical protein